MLCNTNPCHAVDQTLPPGMGSDHVWLVLPSFVPKTTPSWIKIWTKSGSGLGMRLNSREESHSPLFQVQKATSWAWLAQIQTHYQLLKYFEMWSYITIVIVLWPPLAGSGRSTGVLSRCTVQLPVSHCATRDQVAKLATNKQFCVHFMKTRMILS